MMQNNIVNLIPLFDFDTLTVNTVDEDLIGIAIDNGYSINNIRKNKMVLLDSVNKIDVNDVNRFTDEDKKIFKFMLNIHNSKYININDKKIITCMLYDYLYYEPENFLNNN